MVSCKSALRPRHRSKGLAHQTHLCSLWQAKSRRTVLSEVGSFEHFKHSAVLILHVVEQTSCGFSWRHSPLQREIFWVEATNTGFDEERMVRERRTVGRAAILTGGGFLSLADRTVPQHFDQTYCSLLWVRGDRPPSPSSRW